MKTDYANKAFEAIANIEKFDRVYTYPICDGQYIFHRLVKEFANGAEVEITMSYEVDTGVIEIERVCRLSAYKPSIEGKHGKSVYVSSHGFFNELSFNT